MVIRPATQADDEALCRMDLLAPQGTAIRLTERRRTFFSRAWQFPGAVLLVAADERSGQLIGVMGGAPVKLRLAGRERQAGFLFDLKANPEHERGLSRAMFLLWQEVERQLRAAGVEFMYGLVKEDNPAASMYYRAGTQKRGTRTFWSLPVYRRRAVPPEVSMRRGIDAVADYQEAACWYREYDLWPILPDPGILQPLADRYLHAEITCGGASLKIWDGTGDYDRIVTAAPWFYDALRPVANLVRPVIPVPKIPCAGQPLRTWYIYDVRLPTGSRALRSMLAAANNLALAEKVDFLILTASAGEPEIAAGGRGSLATLRYHLLIIEYEPVPELSPRVFLDIRIV